jgi:PAS domain S-box-containing protein
MPHHNSHSDQPQDYTVVTPLLDFHPDLFRIVFDSSSDALFLSLDEDTAYVIECNNRAVELFEAPSKNAFIGSIGGSHRVIPLTDGELRQRTVELDKHGFVCSEAKYQAFSGRIFWAEHLVKRITVGNYTLRLTRITDIDVQKAVEQELLRNKAMFEEAQRIANIGSWEFDVQSQQILWSDETFRLFGLEPQPIAPSLEEYLSMISNEHRTRLQNVMQTTIQTGEDYVIETQVIRRDGVLRYHEGRGKAIRNEDGNVVKLVGTVRDTTERQAAKNVEVFCKIHKKELRYSKTTVLGLN